MTWLLAVWKKRRRGRDGGRIAGRKPEIRREERFSRSRGGRAATETRQSGVKSDES